MTEGSLTQPGPAAEAKPNPFQRIIGVLFSPTSTFESIARRPDILVPLAIVVIVSVACGFLIANHVDFTALAHEAMESAPNTSQMSPQQLERGVHFTSAFMKGMSYASPFLVIIILMIIAGVALIAYRLMAGEGDYRQALSIATYAWYPRMIKGVLGTIVILSRQSIGLYDLQNALRSNPAFLFNPKTQPLQYALASSFDVFSIWSLILYIIGYAAMSRLTRGRSAAIMITLWIIGIALSLIGPAFQAMRMKS